MKKIIFPLLLFTFPGNFFALCNTVYDTLKRNEISASLLPALILFSGYEPVSRYGSYNFGYKHYLKDKTVLRASFSFAPDWSFANGEKKYLRTQDTIHIFSSHSVTIRNRFQVNLGFENIFRTRHFMHGIGAELFLRSQKYAISDPVYWYPAYIDPNSSETLKYSPEKKFPGTIYNGIDSLYYSYDMNDLGLGLQLIYTLHYRINSHFYLSSTIGPYLMLVRSYYNNQCGDRERFHNGYYTRLDAHVLLISDFSLAFRF